MKTGLQAVNNSPALSATQSQSAILMLSWIEPHFDVTFYNMNHYTKNV